jgi:hypothetical protein
MAALAGTLAVFLFMFWQYLGSRRLANAALILNALFTLGDPRDLPRHAHLARHRRHRVDGRHGGRRERADLRTHPRRASRWSRHPRRCRRRLQARVFGHLRLQLHDRPHGLRMLYKLGTGPIRGFGLTLTIGMIVSLFTALFLHPNRLRRVAVRKERTTISIGKSIMYLRERQAEHHRQLEARSALRHRRGRHLLILGFILVPKGNRHRIQLGHRLFRRRDDDREGRRAPTK